LHTPVTRDLVQLAITATLECPGEAPGGVTWDGSHFWVLDEAGETLYCLDRQTGGVHAEAPAEGAGGGTAWDGTWLYQSAPGQYRILVIDPAAGRVVRRIPTRVKASGLAWDGTHLWHGSFSEKRTYLVDAELGDVRGTIDSPVAGGGLVWDGRQFWCCDAGAIYRVDSEGAVLGAYAVDGAPRHLAWAERRLWFTCARDRRLKRVAVDMLQS